MNKEGTSPKKKKKGKRFTYRVAKRGNRAKNKAVVRGKHKRREGTGKGERFVQGKLWGIRMA